MRTAKETQAKGIQAIRIGFHVLDRLASAQRPMPLGDLAEATGMAPSKLRFYLVSFLQLGLVNQDPLSGQYSLGPHAIRLGLAALEQVDVITASKRALYDLVERLGFSAFLAVWGTHGPTIVFRVDGRHKTVLEIRVGTVLPLFNSAIGQVFYTYMPEAATRTLAESELGASPRNGPSRQAAGQIAKAIRQHRVAVARGTLLAGFTAIASPVMDHSGFPAAVISLVGPIGSLDDSTRGKPAQLLRTVTNELSGQLGWNGGRLTKETSPRRKTT